MKSSLLCLTAMLCVITMNASFAQSSGKGTITIHNSSNGCWSIGEGSRLSLALAGNSEQCGGGSAYIGLGEKHVFSGLDIVNCQYTLLIHIPYPTGTPSCGTLGSNTQVLHLNFPSGSTKSEIFIKNKNNSCVCQINFGG